MGLIRKKKCRMCLHGSNQPCKVPNMTDQRRAAKAHSTVVTAAGSHELEAMRAANVPMVEFVKAGGFRGFSARQMFPEGQA